MEPMVGTDRLMQSDPYFARTVNHMGGRKFPVPPKPFVRKEFGDRVIDAQEQSSFLTIMPAEIRNLVYELVVSSNRGMYEAEEEDEEVEEQEKDVKTKDIWVNDTTGYRSILAAQDIIEQESPNPEAIRRGKNKKLQNLAPNTPPPRPPHPLSILLTCRRINAEATLLAFRSYTFITRQHHQTTFYNLRAATVHLSPHQLNAISSLAFELGRSYPYAARRASDFITNSIALFPNLTHLELRCMKGKVHSHAVHGTLESSPFSSSDTQYITPAPHFPASKTEDEGDNLEGKAKASPEKDSLHAWQLQVIQQYVPRWFCVSIRDVLTGRALSWQNGEKWQANYPQFSTLEFDIIPVFDHLSQAWIRTTKVPHHYASDPATDGVEFCSCGCGEPCWTAVNLLQETGREVLVELVFYGDSEWEREKERRGTSVRLRPGVERLKVVEDDWGRGVRWDADEGYWEGLRRRNAGVAKRVGRRILGHPV